MKRTINVKLDPQDPFDQRLAQASDQLPRNHFQLWITKLLRHRLGDLDAEDMRQVVHQDLMGGKLEDGHKRHIKKAPKKQRLERPVASEPLSPAPQSEPLHRPEKKDDDPLQKAAALPPPAPARAAEDKSLYSD